MRELGCARSARCTLTRASRQSHERRARALLLCRTSPIPSESVRHRGPPPNESRISCVVRRPLEREMVYLVGGRRTTDVSDHSAKPTTTFRALLLACCIVAAGSVALCSTHS